LQNSATDPSPITTVYTNLAEINTSLPFLTLTNKFRDQREMKTNLVTQIDVGKYASWLKTNFTVQAKFAGFGPSALYVADNRPSRLTQMPVVRLTNGIAPPVQGFTVATPNPLYVWGNYNCTNSGHLGTTNTVSTVPCALYCDALTVLSAKWSDAVSLSSLYSA